MRLPQIVMALVPSQGSTECGFGHRLHSRNTALDMTGSVICLECVALVGAASERIMGRLIAVMLDLAPMPSRQEVGA